MDIITGLCTGEPFSYDGEHYTVEETTFLPPRLQRPHVPVWGAGTWPLKAPFRRAARWDGVFPLLQNANLEEMMPPSDVRDIVGYVRAHRTSGAPFDVVHLGITRGERREEDIRTVVPYAEAGVTWWLENMLPELYGWEWGSGPYPIARMRERVRGGPPPQPDREVVARQEVRP